MRTQRLSAWIITSLLCQDLGHPAGTHMSLYCVWRLENSRGCRGWVGGWGDGPLAEPEHMIKALPGPLAYSSSWTRLKSTQAICAYQLISFQHMLLSPRPSM